jgi:hypothetical protein
MRRTVRSRYELPAFCGLLAVVIGGAFLLGGHPGEAIFSLVLFGAVGLAFLFGGRSETVRAVRGDLADERWQAHDVRATAFTGIVLTLVLLGAWIVSVARGHDGQPYSAICAVGGASYLVAVIVLRLRA